MQTFRIRWVWVGLLAGCGSGGGGSAGPVVRDSAGIQVVENAAPAWAEGAGWAIADSPSVDIGGVAGDAAYDLDGVAGVLLLAAGRVAVANGGSNEIRVYDASGAHLTTSGRRGSGPGEFQGIAGFWLLAGDSLLVADVFQQRLTVLDGEGKFGRSYSLGGQSGLPIPTEGRMRMALPVGAFGDGSVLGVLQSFTLQDPREGSYRDSVDYVRYGADGTVGDTVGRFPGLEMTQMTLSFGPQSFKAPTAVPLGKNTVSAPSGADFVVATNAAWELEIRAGDGTLRRIVRVNQAARQVTPELADAHRKENRELIENNPMVRNVPEPMREQILGQIEKATYPETYPFIAAILPARDGTLWVEEQGLPGETRRSYAIIDADGRLLGRVRMPPKFRPTQATASAVAGMWEDPDGVEHARVYPIRR
jgi:hypothetical protein